MILRNITAGPGLYLTQSVYNANDKINVAIHFDNQSKNSQSIHPLPCSNYYYLLLYFFSFSFICRYKLDRCIYNTTITNVKSNPIDTVLDLKDLHYYGVYLHILILFNRFFAWFWLIHPIR